MSVCQMSPPLTRRFDGSFCWRGTREKSKGDKASPGSKWTQKDVNRCGLKGLWGGVMWRWHSYLLVPTFSHAGEEAWSETFWQGRCRRCVTRLIIKEPSCKRRRTTHWLMFLSRSASMLSALPALHTSDEFEFCGALWYQKVSLLDSQRTERCVFHQMPSRLPLCMFRKRKQVFILTFCCLLLKCLFVF